MKTIAGYETHFSNMVSRINSYGLDPVNTDTNQLELLSRVSVPIARNLATYLRSKYDGATDADIDSLITYIDSDWNLPAPDIYAIDSVPEAELAVLFSGNPIIKDLEYIQVVSDNGRISVQISDFMSAIIRQSLEEISVDGTDESLLETTQAAIELVYILDYTKD